MREGGLWAHFPEVAQHDEEVIHVDHAIFVEVGCGIISSPYGKYVQQIVDIDQTITSGVTRTCETNIQDLVSTEVGEVAIDRVLTIATQDRIRQAQFSFGDVDGATDSAAL